MSYRRRHIDFTVPIIQLAALVALGLAFFPYLQLVTGVCLVLALGSIFGLLLYRMNVRADESGATTDTRMDSVVVPPHTAVDPGGFQAVSIPELISRLRAIDWFQFEKIIAATFERLGYTVHRQGGANPDGGIDLIVEREGEKTAVQCKHWKTWNVGVRAVREFLGALTDAGLKKGTIVTLCGYTGEARQLAAKHGIEIVNETGVAQLLEAAQATSNREVLTLLHDDRKFCPRCESRMVMRTARKGAQAGSRFWGCSSYPRCRFTMPA